MSAEPEQRSGAPVYVRPPAKLPDRRTRPWALGPVFDYLFFAASVVCVLLLSAVYLRQGLDLSVRLFFLAGFWVLLTYLGLPRLHRVLSNVYVPGYFIGRTHTADGLLGDPVNLALRGTADQLHTALTRAGWVRADPITVRSSWRIVAGSVLRRSYPNAPVSSLLLFSRVQDFAYQQEVAGNPAQRHHVRFWATPPGWLLPGGHRVDWLAAGTYDRAVGLNLFTWQITHKIDADIDVERDYIVDSVRHHSPQVATTVLPKFSTGYHSRNGGGDVVRTDGDLPILELGALVPDPAVAAQVETERTTTWRGLGGRPPALLTGVLLLLVAAASELPVYLTQIPEMPGLPTAAPPYLRTLLLVVVVGVLVMLYLMLALLGWGTWAGRGWARFLLLSLLTLQLLGQLVRWLYEPEGPGWALVSASLYVLAVYALSSLAVREWTDLRRQQRRERRLTGRAAASAGDLGAR